MTVPPERITVKRRRDEEPVDALCEWDDSLIRFDNTSSLGPDIQPRKYRPSALWRRIPAGDTQSQYAVTSTSSPIKGSERLGNAIDEGAASVESKHQSCATRTLSFSRASDSAIQQSELRQPRRFHLAPSLPRDSSPHYRLTNGVQKLSWRKEGRVAVFVEKTRKGQGSLKQEKLKGRLQKHCQLEAGISDKQVEPTPTRKRPNINAADRARRDARRADGGLTSKPGDIRLENATKKIPTPWSHDTEALTAKLQSFALEANGGRVQSTRNTHNEGTLKFKPKPPKPRKQGSQEDKTDETKRDLEHTEENGVDDFVYDTYVKDAASADENKALTQITLCPNGFSDHVRFGVLEVGDEEDVLWESFADVLDQSDSEANSEEEDENGSS